ncbi:Smr/MutS family protein [Ancylobacter sp. Lp-2]|uniref:Smr/MutS family protein n=1 Tax=Ancylobacter sp. Lp-2 TaxID=2881339 RepID=UPI001E4EF609|nr:Smr/MutS family protein [Ancylobacter sp. Lp-2]MCB4767347.1 Smr/MutS family protein [Ancylobacter sp. Lp-2]
MSGKDDQPPRPSRRRRGLAAEDRALWEHVTRSVKRLRPEPPAMPRPEPGFAELIAEETVPKEKPVATAPPKPVSPPRPPAPPPLAPLEPKLRRRLTRGAEVDARLDLHGLTQAAAHHRLGAFLRSAQGQGLAVVLVITGKGGGPAGGRVSLFGEGERGVLRRLVPQWLAEPALRHIVIGFETASRGHGGEGALYVRLRRVREVPR